jgi:putative addiction module component (TIGR02574 family)
MSTNFQELEKQISALPVKEKAALARKLIEDLDETVDPNAEELWAVEAERRLESYLKGELEAVPMDDVIMRVRSRLK